MSKRDKQLLVIIIALVMMLIVMLIGVLVYFGSGEERKPSENKIYITNENPDSIIEKEPVSGMKDEILTEGLEVNTVAGTLFFSEKYSDYVRIEENSTEKYTEIKVLAVIPGKEEIDVFDFNVGIGSDEHVFLGKARGEDGNVYDIYVRTYEMDFSGDWTVEEKQMVQAIQEEINQFIWQIEIIGDTPGNNGEDKAENIVIKTDYIELIYSGNWGKKLKVEQKDKVVRFGASFGNHDEMHLFDITFDGSGDVLGEMIIGDEKIEIGVIVYGLEFDSSWNEKEKSKVVSMQEDMNVIIDNLYKNESFVPKQ